MNLTTLLALWFALLDAYYRWRHFCHAAEVPDNRRYEIEDEIKNIANEIAKATQLWIYFATKYN